MTKTAEKPILLTWSKEVPYPSARDPLGLENRLLFRLSDQLMLGITSITPRARYAAFFAWCCLEYIKKEKGTPYDLGIESSMQKRETALALSSFLHHKGKACEDGGLVGYRKASSWYNSQSDSPPRLLDNQLAQTPARYIYYRPMMALGIFKSIDEENPTEEDETLMLVDEEMEIAVPPPDDELSQWELTEAGKALAEKYDSVVRRLPIANKLVQHPDECPIGELEEFGSIAGLCEVTLPEAADREFLRELYFNHIPIERNTKANKFRRNSLALFLSLMSSFSKSDIRFVHDTFKEAVYFRSVCPSVDFEEEFAINIPPELKDIAHRWQIYYFQYFMTAALESLFISVIRMAREADREGVTIQSIIKDIDLLRAHEKLTEVLGETFPTYFLTMTPREIFKIMEIDIPSISEASSQQLDQIITTSHPFSESFLESLLRGEESLKTAEALAFATILLITTIARYVQWDKTDYGKWLYNSLIESGETPEATKIDLGPWSFKDRIESTFSDWWNTSIEDLLQFIIKHFVVNQHKIIAYERIYNGLRIYFHNEGDRIYSRKGDFNIITVNNSRFPSVIQILIDLGLIIRDKEDKYLISLTDEGEDFLMQELRSISKK